MTGREALKMAAAIVHETDISLYTETAKTWINIILGEMFDLANRRREWRGEDAFDWLPQIDGLDDDLPYDDEMNVRALVKGLVARLFSEDCDNAQLAMYRQEYEIALHELDRAVVKVITERGGKHEPFAAFGI